MSVTVGQAILLGTVQGLTEFLPVSSTAHLAIAQRFLPGFSQPGLLFDVVLHLGTLAAVTVFLWKRIADTLHGLVSKDAGERRAAFRLVGLLALAMALTGLVTMPFKNLAAPGMGEFRRMGFALCGTALLLFMAQRVGTARGNGGRTVGEIRPRDAALVGACQSASAILHGLSRSGNTISMGLFTGMSRQAAAEFSFLLSIPTILAAAAVENWHAYKHHTGPLSNPGEGPAYAVGMVVSAAVGYLAIGMLLRLVVSMRLWPFIVYCATLGLLLIAFGPRLGTAPQAALAAILVR
jgi:undecaprenyl-diphosphatase